MRSYVILEGFEDSLNDESMEGRIRLEMISKLVDEWNRLDRSTDYICSSDDEADMLGDLADEIAYEAEYVALEKNPNLSKDEIGVLREEAIENFYKEVDEQKKEPLVRMNVIEEMLNVLGVRLARPYEHHNEMESYYDYMESRYSSYDDY